MENAEELSTATQHNERHLTEDKQADTPIKNRTLAEIIAEGDVTPLKEKLILCAICDSLNNLHQKQIVIGNLTPETILLDENDYSVSFIGSKHTDPDTPPISAFVQAQQSDFLSPEAAAGEPLDCRADIYSLGMIISRLSGKYYSIAIRCTKPCKDDRYSTISEVKAALMVERKYNWWGLVALIILFAIAAWFSISGRY